MAGLTKKLEDICIGAIFIFHLLYVIGFYETVGLFLNAVRILGISFGLIAILVILIRPGFKNSMLEAGRKILFIMIALVTSCYLVFGFEHFEYRIARSGSPPFLSMLNK